MLRRIFSRKDRFDDVAKLQFATMIAEMLQLQMIVAADESIEDGQGHLKRKALGYVYGYIDAALRTKGHDMADMSIGVPITFQVIRRLWPDHVNECMDFLAKNLQSDTLMNAGIMHGGQQFLDYSKPGAAGVPMGLARFMIEGDRTQT
jgi:hypothetical protein